MTVMLGKDDAYMEILPIIGKIFHPSLLRPFSHFDVNKRHGCNFHRVMPQGVRTQCNQKLGAA